MDWTLRMIDGSELIVDEQTVEKVNQARAADDRSLMEIEAVLGNRSSTKTYVILPAHVIWTTTIYW